MRNKKSIVFLEIHKIFTVRAGIAPVIKLVMANFLKIKTKGSPVRNPFTKPLRVFIILLRREWHFPIAPLRFNVVGLTASVSKSYSLYTHVRKQLQRLAGVPSAPSLRGLTVPSSLPQLHNTTLQKKVKNFFKKFLSPQFLHICRAEVSLG